jgi:tripartite-type tricarboxylate transporter receptor subunit TctC
MLCLPAIALAQTYPVRTVRIILPVQPGGGLDTQGRLLSRRFQESMGQVFIVESRPGASGMIAAELVVKSPADGYTILFGSATLATNVTLYKKVPFDPVRDLAPVGQVSYAPQYLMVHPSVPAKSVKEFIALAKKHPGKLNAGSSGNGTANHLAVEMVKQMAGIQAAHIPYKGSGPAGTALIAGEVDFTFAGSLAALPHIRSGRVRALAVTTVKRSSATPDVPTLDSFYPGYESANWYAFFAPAATPAAIVNRLSMEIASALKSPEIRDFMAKEGAEAVGSTPQEFAAYFRREVERYAKVIKAAGVRIE